MNKPPRYSGTTALAHWDALYQEGDTGWDLGEAAPPFVDLLAGADAPPAGRLIALGSGRGHDALLFAAHGFEVLGVDFAPTAVAAATEAAAAQGLANHTRFLQADIFALPPEYRAAFDVVLEHTCMCALDPRLLDEYAALVTRLLWPGGTYVALFYTHGRPGGPPFTTDAAAIRRLFAPRLEIVHLAPAPRSAPGFAGKEWLGLMRKAQI